MSREATRRIDRVKRSTPQVSKSDPRLRARGRTTLSGRKRYRTGEWKEIFLEELKLNGGCVQYAAEVADIDRSLVYQARQRDEEFAVQLADARDYAVESLEKVATKRALDGSDLLMMFLLKANRPHKYRDNYRLPVSLDEDQLTAITRSMQEALGQMDLTSKQERQFIENLEAGLKAIEEA